MENIKLCPLWKSQCKMEQCIFYEEDGDFPFCAIMKIPMLLDFIYFDIHEIKEYLGLDDEEKEQLEIEDELEPEIKTMNKIKVKFKEISWDSDLNTHVMIVEFEDGTIKKLYGKQKLIEGIGEFEDLHSNQEILIDYKSDIDWFFIEKEVHKKK